MLYKVMQHQAQIPAQNRHEAKCKQIQQANGVQHTNVRMDAAYMNDDCWLLGYLASQAQTYQEKTNLLDLYQI
jgi:hypothetical protein